MDSRREEATKIVEEMNKDYNLSKVTELIKDNKIAFEHESRDYRVRLLNMKEKEELNTLRVKKFNSMLQEKDENGNNVYLTEKLLIQILKDRGDVNIDVINEDIEKLIAEETALQLKLGEEISRNAGETILTAYEDQIKELRTKRNTLEAQKTILLNFSLENQILSYTAKIITYLSLEILEGEKWIRLFNTLDEFENYQDEKLIEKATIYSMLLQHI